MTFSLRLFLFAASSVIVGTLHAQTLGQCFAPYDRGEYRDAFECFSKMAAQGNPAAQLILGEMSMSGRGVPKNEQFAAAWFTMAAEQGLAEAQSNLGVLFATGRGVPQDDLKAGAWYRRAADQGHPKAQTYLGCCMPVAEEFRKMTSRR